MFLLAYAFLTIASLYENQISMMFHYKVTLHGQNSVLESAFWVFPLLLTPLHLFPPLFLFMTHSPRPAVKFRFFVLKVSAGCNYGALITEHAVKHEFAKRGATKGNKYCNPSNSISPCQQSGARAVTIDRGAKQT